MWPVLPLLPVPKEKLGPDRRPCPKVEEETFKNFNLIILGDRGVGKTTLLSRHINANHFKKYSERLPYDIVALDYLTNCGKVRFFCWEVNEGSQGIAIDNCYHAAKGAIIMFDVTNADSYKNVAYWHQNLLRRCSLDLPVVVCANKVDDREGRKVFYSDGIVAGLKYCEMSAEANYNVNKPFWYFVDRLTQLDSDPEHPFPSVYPRKNPELVPADVSIDLVKQKEYENELSLMYDRS